MGNPLKIKETVGGTFLGLQEMQTTEMDYAVHQILTEFSTSLTGSGTININGDVAVAQKFQKLFAMIKPDIEEELSHFVGDIMANNIVKVSKKTGDWLLNTTDILQENIKEYLQEEIKLMPSKYEFNIFSKEVSKIRDDIERLEKKINEFQR